MGGGVVNRCDKYVNMYGVRNRTKLHLSNICMKAVSNMIQPLKYITNCRVFMNQPLNIKHNFRYSRNVLIYVKQCDK